MQSLETNIASIFLHYFYTSGNLKANKKPHYLAIMRLKGWCARRDSNARPFASEANTLSS
jgi:hypothetical protein